jgi:primosomal protein N' (replication factor Y) (superfamily II helicase)
MSAPGNRQLAAYPRLADVIILGGPKEAAQLTYEVPPAMADLVLPGHRVLVPLRSRKLTAMVVGVREHASDRDPAAFKPLLEVLEPRPLLDVAHLKLLEFMSSYYMVPLPEVYRAVMPGAVRVHSRSEFALAAAPGALEEAAFNQTERAVVAALKRHPMTARQLERLCGEGSAAALRRLIADGLVKRREAVRGRHRESTSVTVRIVPGAMEKAPRGKRQRDILISVARSPNGQITLADLERAAPGSKTIVRALAQRGLLELAEGEAGVDLPVSGPLKLNAEQQFAFDTAARAVDEQRFETFLLWGVTASGKTEVYLHLAARCLAAGRQALVMVPEIALTDYLVQSFTARFGSIVAVAHSAQNISERWAAWASLSRQARILLGPRSALFAPIHGLGLIVVDEEHDPAYKQEEAIRYHARDLAVVLGRHSSCPVVLGSATPAAESFANARSGRYRMLQLKRRINDRPLAAVEIVDLRREPRPAQQAQQGAPAPVPLSAALVEALRTTREAGGQSLVFVNRRGYHSFLNCNLCGEVLSCPDCSVSMTFHLRDRSLRCHYCGNYRPAPEVCPACHGFGLQGQGFGTERLAASLAALLPQARIERMDSDTSRRKGARNAILAALGRGEIDILVGTQMITKGFDFPRVTLVGVVMADMGLNLPDFRSAERTFQLLTQAAGRAGRGDAPGRVVIQTFAPHHYSIRAAERQDYARFMRRELELRRELGYPPFTRLAMVRLEGAEAAAVEKISVAAAAAIQRRTAESPDALRVLGPAPAPIERIAQRYRWQLMIKATTWSQMRDPLVAMRDELAPRARAADVTLWIDVDPVHML